MAEKPRARQSLLKEPLELWIFLAMLMGGVGHLFPGIAGVLTSSKWELADYLNG
jgi:hypothetical protein